MLFVGYQAEGTLGRALVDGAPSVKIFDEAIAVNAETVSYTHLIATANPKTYTGFTLDRTVEGTAVSYTHLLSQAAC